MSDKHGSSHDSSREDGEVDTSPLGVINTNINKTKKRLEKYRAWQDTAATIFWAFAVSAFAILVFQLREVEWAPPIGEKENTPPPESFQWLLFALPLGLFFFVAFLLSKLVDGEKSELEAMKEKREELAGGDGWERVAQLEKKLEELGDIIAEQAADLATTADALGQSDVAKRSRSRTRSPTKRGRGRKKE